MIIFSIQLSYITSVCSWFDAVGSVQTKQSIDGKKQHEHEFLEEMRRNHWFVEQLLKTWFQSLDLREGFQCFQVEKAQEQDLSPVFDFEVQVKL